MFIIAALIAITGPAQTTTLAPPPLLEMNVTKKKPKTASVGSGRKFRSCAAARKAGYTHMRRGKAGYSAGLDRDGDGVACDKVK